SASGAAPSGSRTGTGSGSAKADPPLPSWPRKLPPQQYVTPSATAQAWLLPAAMAVTPVSVPVPVGSLTGTGRGWLPPMLPVPSLPEGVLPQQWASPSTVTAQATWPPTTMSATPVRGRAPSGATTCCGGGCGSSVGSPLPRRPSKLAPQQYTVPASVSAQ